MINQEIDWEHVAPEIEYARFWLEWLDKDFNSIKCRDLLAQRERPKLNQKIEVDQTWLEIGKEGPEYGVVIMFITEKSVVYVGFHNEEVMLSKDYFLKHFKRVA